MLSMASLWSVYYKISSIVKSFNILFSNYYMRDFPDVENTSVFFERRK